MKLPALSGASDELHPLHHDRRRSAHPPACIGCHAFVQPTPSSYTQNKTVQKETTCINSHTHPTKIKDEYAHMSSLLLIECQDYITCDNFFPFDVTFGITYFFNDKKTK